MAENNLKKSKQEKKYSKRYFESLSDSEEVKRIDLSKIKPKPFKGEVIDVSLKAKPLSWRHKKRAKKTKPDPSLLKKHSRGKKVEKEGIKTNFFKEKLKRKEVFLEFANEQAARTEILKNEEEGYIIPDENERTLDYTQEQIAQNVDVLSATKHFNLNLNFGPYKFRYTKNGRHLLLGGRSGHVAAFDWVTKKLHCEMNVMEELTDLSWLHVETMFACAQKNWVYFYDNRGTELHCVKKLYKINKVEFLPYHFLLATGSTEGYLSWLDVSIGEMVGHYNSRLGNIRLMQQNAANGVLCIGGANGVVSMWSPNVREPLAKLLCHSTPMSALAVDPKGVHLATSGLDRTIKIWDIRDLGEPLSTYKIRMPASEIDISQKGLLTFAMGNVCEVYHQTIGEIDKGPYIRQRISDNIHGLRFCPYEDVLGVSTVKGFTSLLVPGSGEPNFDATEANPYQTKNQRREHEVHALLEKIPPEFIILDPSSIAGVDVETMKTKVEMKKNLLFVKAPKIDFKSRRKMKGKGGSANVARNKEIVRQSARKDFNKNMKNIKNKIFEEHQEKDDSNYIPFEKSTVLDRFKPKKK